MRRASLLLTLLVVPTVALGAPDLVIGPPTAKELEQQLASSEAEVKELEGERGELARRLAERTRALYRLARRPVLPAGEGLSAFLEHHGRVRRLERVVRQDLETMRLLDERIQAARANVEAKKNALAEERARLEAIERRRKQLEDRARVFAGEMPSLGVAPLPELSTYGGSIVVRDMDESLSLGFASLRGRLGAPVRGTFRVRDAVRDGGPGLEFLVSQGAPVHAVADGRVAYADRDPDHGRLIIVDHGQSFFTVYGGLSAVRARVGAFVAKGEAIGTADASGVYFEIRQGARSLDPRHWTGL